MKFEGTTEYDALLYIPSKAPFDLFHPERTPRHPPLLQAGVHHGRLQGPAARILSVCPKGVVDAPDLNLNVSREILQQDRLVTQHPPQPGQEAFRPAGQDGGGKIQDPFYEEFGAVLKEGIYTDHEPTRSGSPPWPGTRPPNPKTKWVSLDDYVDRMQADQKDIYYITGDKLWLRCINSPHLERLKEKDFEVLLMTDPVDEWVVQSLHEYDGKAAEAALKREIWISRRWTKKRKAATRRCSNISRATWRTTIKEVKPSTRLKNSVACLSGEAYDMSAYMEKILRFRGPGAARGQTRAGAQYRTPGHGENGGAVRKRQGRSHAQGLHPAPAGSGRHRRGRKVSDPSRFSKLVGDLMSRAME
jgi:molecular chaperone HtpG